MKILAICAKDVGLLAVRYLLERFPDDDYEFIVTEPGAADIARLLESRNRPYELWSAETPARLAALPSEHYDWLLNLWGGHILKNPVLSRAKRTLNIHPSLLPYGRGRDCVVWGVRYGHPAGASLHAITEGVDEGPLWVQEREDYVFPIRGADLYDRVVKRCGEMFIRHWPSLRERVEPPQDQGAAVHPTFRRKDLFADQLIDTDADPAARDLVHRLLAHDFAPGYTAQVRIDGRLYQATLALTPVSDAEGGNT